jgi:hypothetical protein
MALIRATDDASAVRYIWCADLQSPHRRFRGRLREETTMVNTANWDKFSKRIILGLLMAAVVAACFLLLGIYIVGAGI